MDPELYKILYSSVSLNVFGILEEKCDTCNYNLYYCDVKYYICTITFYNSTLLPKNVTEVPV